MYVILLYMFLLYVMILVDIVTLMMERYVAGWITNATLERITSDTTVWGSGVPCNQPERICGLLGKVCKHPEPA